MIDVLLMQKPTSQTFKTEKRSFLSDELNNEFNNGIVKI